MLNELIESVESFFFFFLCVCVCLKYCNIFFVCSSESGVGAGIDSYYEYVLKAYILLGDDNYLDRFNKVSSFCHRPFIIFIAKASILLGDDSYLDRFNKVSFFCHHPFIIFIAKACILLGDDSYLDRFNKVSSFW